MCWIASAESDYWYSWEGFSTAEKIPMAGSKRGCFGWGTKLCGAVRTSRVGGTVVGPCMGGLLGPLLFLFCSPPRSLNKINQHPLGILPNRCLTRAWTRRKCIQNREGRETFGGHHCGNVLICAFLRPWESHTRVGTWGHGKPGFETLQKTWNATSSLYPPTPHPP